MTRLHRVYEASLLLIREIEELFILYGHVDIIGQSQLLGFALVLPDHEQVVQAWCECSNGKHDDHGLEARCISRGLALEEELRANDERDGVANEENRAGDGSLRVAGDVGGRESKHHRQGPVGEVGAIECNKPADLVLSRKGVHKNRPYDGGDIAEELHQTASVGVVVCEKP